MMGELNHSDPIGSFDKVGLFGHADSGGNPKSLSPLKSRGESVSGGRFMFLALAIGLGACTVEPAAHPERQSTEAHTTASANGPSAASPRGLPEGSPLANLRTSEATRPSAAQALDASRRTAIVRAAENVAPAVVTISVIRRERNRRRSFFDDYYLPFRETQGLGSGFIIDADGTVLTNHHVIQGAFEMLVTLPDGRDFPATLVGTDPTTDVAVVKLTGGADLPTAPLGTANDLLIGEWALAIGNPFGRLISNPEPTVTAGVVSALGRHIVPSSEEDGFYLGMIQTDASINPGNSGGPLLNAQGEVIGINSSIFTRSGGSEGLGFAIPIDRAMRVASDLIAYGEVRRAWLGMDVDAVDADAFGRSRGVRVARITPGSPAAVAGITPGARLLSADGRRMATPLDFEAVVLDLRAGDRVELMLEGAGDGILIEASRLPSASATRVELTSDLEVITVTPAIQAERGLASASGALVVEISDPISRATGLAAGDVILAVNNTQVATAEEAAAELRRTQRSQRRFVLVFERSGRIVRTGFLQWR